MKIGFVGLGIMGRPMAMHLKDAGHEIHVPERPSLTPEIRAAAKVLPACSSSVRGDGEGEDGGSRAREEGDGEGEGEEIRSGQIFFEGRLAAGLDPGPLHALDDQSR